MTYPTEISPAMLKKMAHLTDGEVRRDIMDTEHEIVQLQRQLEAETLLATVDRVPHEAKLNAFRASVRPAQIQERQAFVAFLKRLLQARGVEVLV